MHNFDALEILKNAKYNLSQIKSIGLLLLPTIEAQIQEAINILEQEEDE